jgi:type IV pilus assembly protein PilX
MKTVLKTYRTVGRQMYKPIHKQRGVVLFVALIVLVAMSLAGVSMMRAVDTGTKVAGNIASRQSAANAADTHFETALSQIVAMVANGSSRSGGAVGFSTVALSAPVEARNWALAQDMGIDPKTGNHVEILIDRLCSGSVCELTLGDPQRAVGRGIGLIPFRPAYQHFRTIARITDPKGLVTYIEYKND